jgi:hypothetical protein
VIYYLNDRRRKELIEGVLITTIRYGLEVISCGTEHALKKLSALQSRAARMALQWKRKDYSRSKGLEELGWLSVPQMAAQTTIKLAIKTIQHKKPENLYEALTTSTGELRHPSEATLKNGTLRIQ